MVNLAGTPWVADSLGVPGQTHRQTVDLGVGELGKLAALDLLTDAAASDGLAVDCTCLVLAEEDLVEVVVLLMAPLSPTAAGCAGDSNAAPTCIEPPQEGRQVTATGESADNGTCVGHGGRACG